MSNRAGYSLFEVLVAFAVMTTVLGVLVPGQVQLMSRAAQVEERFLAHDFSLSKLDLIEFSNSVAGSDNLEDYRGWQIRTEFLSLEDTEGSSARLVRISVLSRRGELLARSERYLFD